jgi:hypothetical protein
MGINIMVEINIQQCKCENNIHSNNKPNLIL